MGPILNVQFDNHTHYVWIQRGPRAFKISFFMLTDPDIPMNSIVFYHRSDQRKGKMKPPPNPFTQVLNIFTNTHDN